MKQINFALSAFLVFSSASARADAMYGLGLEGGGGATKSSDRSELDKKGSTFSGYGGISTRFHDTSYLTLLLGAQAYTLKETDSRGREQEVKPVLGLLQADYRYSLVANMELGVLGRLTYGQAATLKASDLSSKTRGVLNLGPQLAYRWVEASYDLVFYLASTWDLTVKKEVNSTYVAGVQYWIKERVASLPVPKPAEDLGPIVEPEPTPPAPEEPPPAEALLVLRFKTDTFKFEYNSEKLIPASAGNADAIGKILASFKGNWEKLEVGGHADGKASRRNTELSELRAKSIFDAFVKQGVDASTLSAKGYGSTEPLAGLDASSPDNRRVELKMSGVRNGQELKTQLEAFLIAD